MACTGNREKAPSVRLRATALWCSSACLLLCVRRSRPLFTRPLCLRSSLHPRRCAERVEVLSSRASRAWRPLTAAYGRSRIVCDTTLLDLSQTGPSLPCPLRRVDSTRRRRVHSLALASASLVADSPRAPLSFVQHGGRFLLLLLLEAVAVVASRSAVHGRMPRHARIPSAVR